LTGGFLTLIAWLGLTDFGFEFAIERAVTVMVIACPHVAIEAGDIVLVRSNPLVAVYIVKLSKFKEF